MNLDSIFGKRNSSKKSAEGANEQAPIVGSVELPAGGMNAFNNDKEWALSETIWGFTHDTPPQVGEMVKVREGGKDSLAVITEVGATQADSMTGSDNSYGFTVKLKNPKYSGA